MALYALSNYDEAIQAYDKAIEIDTQFADAWYDRAWLSIHSATTIRLYRLMIGPSRSILKVIIYIG